MELQSKLNTACLLVIAISLSVIAYRQVQPVYTETEKGIFLDTRTGKFYHQRNGRLIPVYETMEDRLKKEYPEGTKY